MSALGQPLPVAISTQPSFERLFRSVTCRIPYTDCSAIAAGGSGSDVGQVSRGLLPLAAWIS